MNGCRILLFQNEESEKDTNFASLIAGPLHSYILKPSLVWPKPSFALAPQAQFYLATSSLAFSSLKA